MLSRRAFLSCVLATGAVATLGRPATASTSYRQVVDLTMPTAQGRSTFTNDYRAGRGGGQVHGATDLMGAMGDDVHAAVGGTIGWIPQDPHPTAGYAIQVQGDDGRVYAYYHLGPWDGAPSDAYAPGIARGVRVDRGQVIGYRGNSGNARHTPPHLHFEIHDDRVTDAPRGHRINPYYSLLGAQDRGDYPGLPPVTRVAGSNRIRTSVALSEEAFASATTVVVASAWSFADSVTAGPLAAALGGPVLTTGPDRLDPAVAGEIARLGATSARVIGGTAALSDRVASDLTTHAGIPTGNVERLAGPNAFATAASVAGAVWNLKGRSRALVALGRHADPSRAWPDAVTAGYYGAVRGIPVLLVAPGTLPDATATALDGLSEAIVVGGTAAVSEPLRQQIAQRVGQATRIAGDNRYSTATSMMDSLLANGLAPTRVWAASGASFPDALAAGPVVAERGDALVLVDGAAGGSDGATDAWLRARADRFAGGTVIGGTAAVNDAAATLLADRIG